MGCALAARPTTTVTDRHTPAANPAALIRKGGAWAIAAAVAGVIGVLTSGVSIAANEVVAPAPSVAPAPVGMMGMGGLVGKLPAATNLIATTRTWASLSPAEKAALQPLADIWPKLREEQRQKWLAFAPQYNKLSPDERARIQRRMTDWARLSTNQRNQARLNFNELKRLDVDKKSQWQAYQALPEEEKDRLAKQAKQASPKTTAPVLDPQRNSTDRMTRVPAPKGPPPLVTAPGVAAKSLVTPGQIQPGTLLPKPAPKGS